MTIIDREALRDAFVNRIATKRMTLTTLDIMDVLDAAPAVCCERCEHYVGDCEVPICDHDRGLDYPDSDEGCSNFEEAHP